MQGLSLLLILPLLSTASEIHNGSHSGDEIAQLFSQLKNELSGQISKLEDDLEERVTKLEELTKAVTLRSCSEYADFGVRTTGIYMIDPDGPLIGQEPFGVRCNFSSGATEVLHNAGNLTQVEHCHDPGKRVSA